jgi:hypothetical protein
MVMVDDLDDLDDMVSSIRIDPFTVIPETVRLTDQTSRLATSRTVIIEQQMTARYQ